MAFIYFLHMRNAVYGILFILLNTSTTISLRINSNRHSLHTTSRSTHSDLRMASTMRDMTAFHSLQFQLLKQYQLGNWIGIQTGYAEESSDVADFMYCNEDLVLSPDESEVMHTRSLVLGEIRADCEVCFDSERLKTKVIGKYSAGNIRSRFCENVELRGPGLTPRGLSLEFVVAHEERRIRVLLAFTPIDFKMVSDVGEVPIAYALKDIVIVRERRDSRPLNTDISPDVLWTPVGDEMKRLSGQGTRRTCLLDGSVQADEVHRLLGTFSSHQPNDATLTSRNNSEEDDDEEEPILFSRVFPGGILVECDAIIAASTPAQARVTWLPKTNELNSPNALVYAADIDFIPRDDLLQTSNGNLAVATPTLSRFSVDLLHTCSNT